MAKSRRATSRTSVTKRRSAPRAGKSRRTATHEAPAFEHPLATRYASKAMLRVWSREHRYGTWRRIWLALAEAQHEIGLPVSKQQVAALRKAVDRIDFAKVARYEAEFRHDVMAHIHAYGDAAPSARGVIHLGATSMDIVDNADLLLTRDALELVVRRLAAACRVLAAFCAKWADEPTLGFTHLQPAQLTTIGKRATLWLADLLRDLLSLSTQRENLLARGLRGATGTQASFLKLLGVPAKVQQLEERFLGKLGFAAAQPVTGQTYSRKVDTDLLFDLASFAASVQRICNDIRLLQMLGEIEEPFGKKQVGSSAMPWKRNPARSERATGLARYLLSLATSPPMTHAAQMFERTLDDSANKRLVFPEAFLTADALTLLLRDIFDGLVVHPAIVRRRVAQELPLIATEEILMNAAAAGGDRQKLHEALRQHSHAAVAAARETGSAIDLVSRLKKDASFKRVNWKETLRPERHVGLAPQQTREFLERYVEPVLRLYGTEEPPADAPVV